MPTSPLGQALAFQNAVQPAQTPISPTDVIGAYKLASDVAEKNYQAKLQAQNALWGGLASLGAAGLIGFGPTMAKKYFGTAAAAPAAAPGSGAAATGAADAAAAPTTTGAIDAGTGSVAADMGLSDLTGGTVADLGAAAAPTVAADLGAAAPAADMTAMTAPDFLASFLPFLA